MLQENINIYNLVVQKRSNTKTQWLLNKIEKTCLNKQRQSQQHYFHVILKVKQIQQTPNKSITPRL